MNTTKPRQLLAALQMSAFVIGAILVIAATAQPRRQTPTKETVSEKMTLPLVLGHSIPLAVHSPGVEWKGNTFHLVNLGSIQFQLDKQDRLKAEIQAGVTTFDEIDYDISAAVFDEAGHLLGTARAQCKVERLWLGRVLTSPQTVSLDFGVSLDYQRASSFMISVSKRKVLTPDEWRQK